MKSLSIIFVALLLIGMPHFVFSAEAGEDVSSAANANNPLANMTAFNIQNYYVPTLYDTPDVTLNTSWLRFAKPVGNFLVRASLPVPTAPDQTGLSTSGIGDLNAFSAYLLSDQNSSRQVGIGPLVSAPTASESFLGADQWQAGAAAVLFDASSPVVQWGGLVTWQTGLGTGDDDQDISLLVTQPFLFLQLGGGTYLRSAPLWVFDLESGDYNMPMGIGLGKVIKKNNTVFNLFLEPQYTFLHKGAGQPALQIFMGINLQFLPGS